VPLKKILYVILDGLGDDPNPALGGATPLEAARTPNLDRLAAAGRNGYVTTVGEGIAPESDIAVFAVLGYDPRDHHSGRGPLESPTASTLRPSNETATGGASSTAASAGTSRPPRRRSWRSR
jgi:2,3-bisphosphoglycerate-independent phosphoglycerate mutase